MVRTSVIVSFCLGGVLAAAGNPVSARAVADWSGEWSLEHRMSGVGRVDRVDLAFEGPGVFRLKKIAYLPAGTERVEADLRVGYRATTDSTTIEFGLAGGTYHYGAIGAGNNLTVFYRGPVYRKARSNRSTSGRPLDPTVAAIWDVLGSGRQTFARSAAAPAPTVPTAPAPTVPTARQRVGSESAAAPHPFDELWASPAAQATELRQTAPTSRATPADIYRNRAFADLASQVFNQVTQPITSASNHRAAATAATPPPATNTHGWTGIRAPQRAPVGSIDRAEIARLRSAMANFDAARTSLSNDRIVPTGLLQTLWTAHLAEVGREYRGRLTRPYPDSTTAELIELGIVFRNVQEVLRDKAVGYESIGLEGPADAGPGQTSKITAAATRIVGDPELRQRLYRGTSLAGRK
jgi:hypothetical protein